MARVQDRYVWDKRPGYFFVEWWEGRKRRREVAGRTPSEAAEAQRRKRNELIGELVAGGAEARKSPEEGTATPIADATAMFLDHVRVHSPDKPRTHRRYEIVLQHFIRILSKTKYVEALTRADIDDYKSARSKEVSEQHKQRAITPRTVNFEVSVLRTFFYFLINERGLRMENPCARFKPLKDQMAKANRRPPTYTQAELDRLFVGCDQFERTIFATLLLTGLREQELYFLKWPDVLLSNDATVRVHGEGKDGFSPKDYEERIIPIPNPA